MSRNQKFNTETTDRLYPMNNYSTDTFVKREMRTYPLYWLLLIDYSKIPNTMNLAATTVCTIGADLAETDQQNAAVGRE